MSFGSALAFGGGLLGGQLFGGGGGGSQARVQRQAGTFPEQQQLLRQLASFLQPQIGAAPRVPGMELGPVGPSPLQQQAFGLAGQLPQQQAFDPSQITAAMQPVGQFARQGFQQETIPAIMGALGAQGAARSSGAADILAREGRNLELGLAAQFGPMQFGAQQAALGRQMQLPTQMANIGAVQRGIPAEQQQFGLQRFQAADPLRSPALPLALQTAGQPSFQAENLIRQGTPGMLQQFLPLAGQLAGAAGQAGGFQNLFSGLF